MTNVSIDMKPTVALKSPALPPAQSKPTVRPPSSRLGASEDTAALKKRIEELEKALENERTARIEMEQSLRKEIGTMKEDWDKLLQRLSPLLTPPTRRPPPLKPSETNDS